MFGHLTALLLALGLSVSAASAQQSSPDITMHRKGAGQLDASGWTKAESTQGGFSVRLPIRFNDFTVEMSDPDSPAVRLHAVGGTSTEGVKFLAARMVYRDDAAAKLYFSRLASGDAFPSRPDTIKSHMFQGRKSVDIVFGDNGSVGHTRFVLLEGAAILLSVEIPAARRSLVGQEMIATYFDSLDIARP